MDTQTTSGKWCPSSYMDDSPFSIPLPNKTSRKYLYFQFFSLVELILNLIEGLFNRWKMAIWIFSSKRCQFLTWCSVDDSFKSNNIRMVCGSCQEAPSMENISDSSYLADMSIPLKSMAYMWYNSPHSELCQDNLASFCLGILFLSLLPFHSPFAPVDTFCSVLYLGRSNSGH